MVFLKKFVMILNQLYAGIYREMSINYERKLEESEIKVKETIRHLENEYNGYEQYLRELQIEYNEIQEQYAYEAEWEIKLKSTYCK